ncbi:MAG: hypothetical protein ACXVZX_02980 [Terriglobales bacterium]
MEKQEILQKLKAELGALEYGRTCRSVHMPWEEISFFQDSVTCLNYGLDGRPNACGKCMLMQFVPGSSRNEKIPCHHIPLDAKGNTIQNLDRGYNRHSVEEAVIGWLRGKIAELEKQLRPTEAIAKR